MFKWKRGSNPEGLDALCFSTLMKEVVKNRRKLDEGEMSLTDYQRYLNEVMNIFALSYEYRSFRTSNSP